MLAPATQPLRVRCRQIAESDFPALAELLTRGFPRSNRTYWTQGFERFKTLPPVDGMPRFGHVLENEQGPVGVLLLMSSQRPDGRIIANLSSWYVEPEWRAHSTVLVSVATRHKHVTYLNASPAPHTWRTLEAQGFHAFNFGRSATFPALGIGGGRISENIPADLPERQMQLDHRALGCISLVCEKNGLVSPFIFKPRRLDRPPVPMWDLLYCRATAEFARWGAALGRHALARGALGILIDGRVNGMVAHYVAGKEPRFYKGPAAPSLNDLAYSEKVILG